MAILNPPAASGWYVHIREITTNKLDERYALNYVTGPFDDVERANAAARYTADSGRLPCTHTVKFWNEYSAAWTDIGRTYTTSEHIDCAKCEQYGPPEGDPCDKCGAVG